MLSRHAHAQVRLDLAETLRDTADYAPVVDEALENVRRSIAQLDAMTELEAAPPASTAGDVLPALRHDAEQRADREALAALRAQIDSETEAVRR